MARKLFVKAYGCQMNVYDAERMYRTHGHLAGDVGLDTSGDKFLRDQRPQEHIL